MVIRPDAVVLPSGIALGLEVCFSDGVIDAIRPWTTETRNEKGLVLSPQFVNCHSHLEYYDWKGQIAETEYWPWIREITRRKALRSPEEVRRSIHEAANKNVETGVWAMAEWSDWVGSDEAMRATGIEGVIFQEVITVREWDAAMKKLCDTRKKCEHNQIRSFVTPHATYTVHPDVIADLAATGDPISIHAAETPEENDFFMRGEGPIRDLYQTAEIDVQPPGYTAIGYLDSLAALRGNTQLVHACAASHDDIALIAERGCSVAHCPRSNLALGCPAPEIGKMLDLGIRVGLGLDSAASSGEIDMFAEMRAAVAMSAHAERPVTPAEAWHMATRTDTVPYLQPNDIEVGAAPRLMLLECVPEFGVMIGKSPKHLRRIEQSLRT